MAEGGGLNSIDRESAQDYLQRTGITELFEKLTCDLLNEQPERPVDFIIDRIEEIAGSRYSPQCDSFPNNGRLKQVTKPCGNPSEDEGDEGRTQQNVGCIRRRSAWKAILSGCLDDLPPLPSNIVRFFLSSTFSDFKAERTVLPRYAYPKLQQFCAERGLDFQVVDMRWGVTDEMVNDHTTSTICRREISLCQQLSRGPCFVAMLGHRYGYQPLPPVIQEKEFHVLRNLARWMKMKHVALLDKWYLRDGNAVPSQYCLQPISDMLPDYNNTDPSDSKKHSDAKERWNNIYQDLQGLLRRVVSTAVQRELLSSDRKERYFTSVTEEEIHQGILQEGSAIDGALCYVRELEGIRDVPMMNSVVCRYLDVLEENVIDETAQSLLSDLVNQKLPRKMPPDHRKAYTTKWTGIPLETFKEENHQNYLRKFSSDFVRDVQTIISERAKTSILDVPDNVRQLYLEVLLHCKFCLMKCEVFCGQENILAKIKNYLNALDSPHLPFIVHGRSGYGKTSLLAYVGKHAKEMSTVKTVVMRFLGTSPGSSSIRSVLLSVTRQLSVLYGIDTDHLGGLEMMSEIRREFAQTLQRCGELSKDNKLLIILDSVDQLSPSNGSHKMLWLPRVLPPNVGLVISMLNDRYTCFAAVKEIVKDPEAFVELKEIPVTTGEEIIQEYLKTYRRQITEEQRELLLTTFACCPQPLFLKLLLGQAVQWKSYSRPSGLKMITCVQAAINQLFQRLEDKFGQTFVRIALGYLTCGKDGLTGVEMEDVLSCDNEVLDEVYAFHDPPLPDVIRVPPLLWARLQFEIKEYLVERQADGKTVMAWYHRLFWETAADRFVYPEAKKIRLHRNLADIFKTEDTVRKSIVLSKRRNFSMINADRQVSPQPLTASNVRKLNALPYHLYHSEQFESLRSRCLLDFSWVLTKLKAVSVTEIVNDYEMFCSIEPLSYDGDLCLLRDFLQLAYEPLKDDPQQLAYQALERLGSLSHRYSDIGVFVQDAKKWTESTQLPLLLPVHNTNLRSPESALKHSALVGNTGVIGKGGQIAICGFLDKLSGRFKVQIWSLSSKDIVESIDSNPKHSFALSGDSTVMAIVSGTSVNVYDTCSGDLLGRFLYRSDKFQKCDIKNVCIDEKGHFVIIGAKICVKSKGNGVRYRSDVRIVDLRKQMLVHVIDYSTWGARCLENIVLIPAGKQFAVIDYSRITVYCIDTAEVSMSWEDFSEIKADTFSCSENGKTLLGTFGGFHAQNSRIMAVNLVSGEVTVSEALFHPTAVDEEDRTTSELCPSSDDSRHTDSDSEDSETEDCPFIARTFAMVHNSSGTLVLAGVSSVGEDRKNCVTLWESLENNVKCVKLPVRPERFPKCLAVFPDWTMAVVGWDDGLFFFLHLVTMALSWEIKAHEMSVNVMQILPSINTLISIGTDRKLKIWDLKQLQTEATKHVYDPSGQATTQGASLDENEQVVDFCCTNTSVVTALPYPTSPPRLWSTESAQPRVDLNSSLESQYSELYPEKSTFRKDAFLAFIQNGRFLVDVRRRRAEASAVVVDMTSQGRVVSRFETFNPHCILDDRYFLTAMFGDLVVRELPSGKVCRTVQLSAWPDDLVKEHINLPPHLAITADDKYLVFINLTGSVKYVEIIDLLSYKVVCKTDIPPSLKCASFLSGGLCYLVLDSNLRAMICSPDHHLTNKPEHVAYRCPLKSEALSPSGSHGITVQSDSNTFTLWNTESLDLLYTTRSQAQKIHCVCFAPNELFLLTGSYNVVTIWSLETGKVLSKIHTYGAVCRLRFTPNGCRALIQCYAAPKRKRLIICKTVNMTVQVC